MTPWIDSTVTGVERVWQVLDTQVEAGRFPGYVAAVRIRGTEHVRAGGRTALEPSSPPMRDDTQFRIASITKPVGAALTLALVRDGVLALDDPIGRWLPEAAEPRVLASPDGALDDTVPAERPVTVRDLLAGTSGWGIVMERTPLQAAMIERGRVRQPAAPRRVRRTSSSNGSPACRSPSNRARAGCTRPESTCSAWLLTRATGRRSADLVAERITGPLGTGVDGVRESTPTRLAHRLHPRVPTGSPCSTRRTAPSPSRRVRGAELRDSCPPRRRSCGFFSAMADGGAPVLDGGRGRAHDDGRADRRAAPVRAGLPRRRRVVGAWAPGWTSRRTDRGRRPAAGAGRAGPGPRRYVDPIRDTVAVLMTQRAMTGPHDGFDDFWTAVAACGR